MSKDKYYQAGFGEIRYGVASAEPCGAHLECEDSHHVAMVKDWKTEDGRKRLDLLVRLLNTGGQS